MSDEWLTLDAIRRRHSTRRYDARPLDDSSLQKAENVLQHSAGLCPENNFGFRLLRQVDSGQIVELIGAYGRIANPPHLIVPYMVGGTRPLADIGFRMERLAVWLAAGGLGSCFLGAMHAPPDVLEELGVPADAAVGAVLAMGRPADSVVGRAVDSVVHGAIGAGRRFAVEKVFFEDEWSRPAQPPEALREIVRAAQWAPSAVNAQPWRFRWREGRLEAHVVVGEGRYRTSRSDYRLFDGGLCLANIDMALQVLGQPSEWTLAPEGTFTESPLGTLEHLASIRLA